MKYLLASIYEFLVYLKNELYDWGMLDQFHVQNKVISVGNLTSGGTGKTPVISLILNYLNSKQLETSVISLNYKANVQVASEVDADSKYSAKFYGDEPVMLAKRHPQSHFFVGPNKYLTAFKAAQKYPLATLLIDDGFQHRQLKKNLEIVCLDTTQSLHEYEFLPIGKARDPFSELKRADLIILNKINRAEENHLKYLKNKIPKEKIIVETEVEIKWPPEVINLTDKKIVLGFCGIGQPKNFKAEILRIDKFHLKEFIIFADHFVYSKNDVEAINIKAKSIGAEFILTTEKDFVKLSDFKFDVPLLVPDYNVIPTFGANEFYACLDSCIFNP